jgi:ankyrin repeat protein
MFFEIASKNGFKEIVKILIKYDADVNLRDKDGNTALIWGLY